MTPKHTNTPWHIAAHSDGAFNSCIRDDKGWSVAYVTGCKAGADPRGDANAAFIVRAVNAHEALVEALETFQRANVSPEVESYLKWCSESGPASHVETTERERIARAAFLAGWSRMWSTVAMKAENALRAARGEA